MVGIGFLFIFMGRRGRHFVGVPQARSGAALLARVTLVLAARLLSRRRRLDDHGSRPPTVGRARRAGVPADAASPIPAMSIAVFHRAFLSWSMASCSEPAFATYPGVLIKKRTGSQTGRRTRGLWQNRPISAALERGPVSGETWLSRLSGRSDPMESYLAVVWGAFCSGSLS